jgi:hypothetical protein
MLFFESQSNILLKKAIFIKISLDSIQFNLGCLGLEPRTIRLKAEYSTIELATLSKY